VKVGAKQKRDADFSQALLHDRGAAWMLTPSASSTSALPHWLDTDRLPCLAIRMPQAASTIADAVEMLNVPDRSPPVPHVSKTGPGGGAIAIAFARIVCAKPTSSVGRSPFIPSPMSSPAVCAGVASPFMIAAIAAAASAVVRSSWRRSFSNRAANMITSREVAKDAAAFVGQHRLRMKLHSVIGIVRCRSPITSPSSLVRASTSRSAGIVFSPTISEW
jgi:hypothetical protein